MHCSLKKGFLSLLAILWNSAFSWMYLFLYPLLFTSLVSSAICKSSLDNHFAFLLFYFFGMVLFASSCTILQISTHSSSGTLFTKSNPFNLFVTSTAYSLRIWFKLYLASQYLHWLKWGQFKFSSVSWLCDLNELITIYSNNNLTLLKLPSQF